MPEITTEVVTTKTYTLTLNETEFWATMLALGQMTGRAFEEAVQQWSCLAQGTPPPEGMTWRTLVDANPYFEMYFVVTGDGGRTDG